MLRYDPLTRNTYNIPDGVPETEIQRFVDEQRRAANANLASASPASGLAALGGFAQSAVQQIGQAQNSSILPDISPGAAWGMTPEQFRMLNGNMMEDAKNRQNREQQAQQQQMQAQQDEARTAIAREGMDVQRQQMEQQQALAIARENQRQQQLSMPKVIGSPSTGLYSVGRDGNMNPIIQTLIEGTAAPKVARMQDGTTRQWNPETQAWETIAGVGPPKESGSGGGKGGEKKQGSTTMASVDALYKKMLGDKGQVDPQKVQRYIDESKSISLSSSGKIALDAAIRRALPDAIKQIQEEIDKIGVKEVTSEKSWFGSPKKFTYNPTKKLLLQADKSPAANQAVQIGDKSYVTDSKGRIGQNSASGSAVAVARRPDGSVVKNSSGGMGRFEAALSGTPKNEMPIEKLIDGEVYDTPKGKMRWTKKGGWTPVK